jgi:uncharacterized membrane protein YgdD (TMEM256/DUF423 family)
MRTGERTATIRLAGFVGALFAAFAVALSAYAAHASIDPEARQRLTWAAAFAFGHGVAIASLARHGAHWLGALALYALMAGVLLFAGSLAGGALANAPTSLAPIGGMLSIGGWLVFAVHSLRR